MSQGMDETGTSEVLTFLIADLRGYTAFTQQHGDERAAALTEAFARIATEAVEAQSGRLKELRGDEAMATFTSARKALRAAVDLQERLAAAAGEDLPLRAGIGLDVGEAIPVRGGYRTGALNLAARLCSLAGPGEVLSSQGVVHLARRVDGIEYHDHGSAPLKGFDNPVPVIRVTRAGAEPEAPASGEEASGPAPERLPIGGFLGALPAAGLVARTAELQEMTAALVEAAAGAGRLVFLSGEAGVGKTRLAQEVTLEARNRGFLVATGRSYEARETVAYYPFLEALSRLYVAAPAAVRQTIPTRWPYLARLLPETSLPVPARSDQPEEDQERLFWAVHGFLQTIAAETPLALFLDDLHWADGSTLLLLSHLARQMRTARLFLLATYRDTDLPRRHLLASLVNDLARERVATRIALRGLSGDETGRLVAASIGEPEVSSELADLLHRRTEGNPFFIEEVVRALVEHGDVYRTEGGWERRDLDQIEIPETIRAVIERRVARLGEATQEVLSVAGVLGQEFRFEALVSMLDPALDAETAIDEACQADLIRESGVDVYAFNHALTQAALYAGLPARRQRRLHLAAGETLIALAGEGRSQAAAEIAWHFLQGGDTARALEYSLLAGDASLEMLAYGEADRHFETAARLAREAGGAAERSRALEGRAQALHMLSRYEEAIRLWREVLALPGGDRETRLRATASLARDLRLQGDAQAGIDAVRPVLEAEAGAEPSAGLASLYSALAEILWSTGDCEECLTAAERAAAIAREVGEGHILAEAEVRRGTVLMDLGRMEESITVLRAALELAESLGDHPVVNRATNNVGAYYVQVGEMGPAEVYARRALDMTEQANTPGPTVFALANLGGILAVAGRFEEAERYLARSEEMNRTLPASWTSAEPLATRGMLRLMEGRLEEAEAKLREGYDASMNVRNREALCSAASLLGLIETWAGRPDQAIERLQACVAEAGDDVSRQLWLRWSLALARLEVGEGERALEISAAGLRDADALHNGFVVGLTLWAEAVILRRLQRWDECRTLLDRGLPLSRSMPFPWLEGLLLLEQGRLPSSQEESREAFSAALAVFTRLGCRTYPDWARAALDALEAGH